MTARPPIPTPPTPPTPPQRKREPDQETISLRELSEMVAGISDYPRTHVRRCLSLTLEIIAHLLATQACRRVLIDDFGSFEFRVTGRGKSKRRRLKFYVSNPLRLYIEELSKHAEHAKQNDNNHDHNHDDHDDHTAI